MVHPHSVSTYHETIKPTLNHRQAVVMDAYLERYGEAMTDRDALSAIGGRDMNEVRPRITELVELGCLIEVGHAFDPITGRRVRTCMASAVPVPTEQPTTNQPTQEELL